MAHSFEVSGPARTGKMFLTPALIDKWSRRQPQTDNLGCIQSERAETQENVEHCDITGNFFLWWFYAFSNPRRTTMGENSAIEKIVLNLWSKSCCQSFIF